MLLMATAFGLVAVLAAVTAVVAGALAMLVNAVIAGAIAALFAIVAVRQRIVLDRNGVVVRGFGSMGRRIRWKDVERLELTDASRWRLGPRLVIKGGRSLPVPAQWRLEDKTRLPVAVLAWSRWARIHVVGERVTGRRWPIIALVAAGAVSGMVATAAGA